MPDRHTYIQDTNTIHTQQKCWKTWDLDIFYDVILTVYWLQKTPVHNKWFEFVLQKHVVGYLKNARDQLAIGSVTYQPYGSIRLSVLKPDNCNT